MALKSWDYLIVGAGIIGLTLARALKTKFPHASILILEKESELGQHASGRNSGVVHAGLYYPPGSLKANLCIEGSALLKAYCQEHKLFYQEIGKIVLPTEPSEAEALHNLYQRALKNRVKIEKIDSAQLRELEPDFVSCTGQALFSPQSAISDPKAVLAALAKEITELGVDLYFGCAFLSIDLAGSRVLTNLGSFAFGQMVNAAGVNADTIAHQCGLADKFRILPFRGSYYQLTGPKAEKLRHLIYPVPDLEIPFLGIHFTPSASGNIYVGPNAVPALGRENYSALQEANFSEAAKTALSLTQLFWKNHKGFRQYTIRELKTLTRSGFLASARKVLPSLLAEDLKDSNKVGIRAQIVDLESMSLVLDFLTLRQANTLHILNAVSPAYTSSFAIAKYLCDRRLV